MVTGEQVIRKTKRRGVHGDVGTGHSHKTKKKGSVNLMRPATMHLLRTETAPNQVEGAMDCIKSAVRLVSPVHHELAETSLDTSATRAHP